MTTVVCWDIDGTLLTTGRAGMFAWQGALRDVCGIDVDLENVLTAGMTDAQIAEELLERYGGDPGLAEPLLRRYEELLPESLHRRQGAVLEGVREALEALSARDDVLTLLLTGNTPAGAAAKLAHYGLDSYFPLGAFCEGPGDRAEIARRALETAIAQLGVSPELDRVFVIGDTPHDVRCGKAIGARTIAVSGDPKVREALAAEEPWLLLERLPSPEELLVTLGVASVAQLETRR
jgi:phosphoglycolate phosphatase